MLKGVVALVAGGTPRNLAILLLLSACAPATPPPSRDSRPSSPVANPEEDPKRFEAEIRAFEAQDRRSPPPTGGILFVGSSSIKNWTGVAADFPGLPVLNRGFGGSTLADVVYYMNRIVLPYQPRLVVLYAGDNDLTLGRTPDRVLADYRAFVARLRSAEPAARVVYLSIKPSPSRRAYLERARESNRLIQAENRPRYPPELRGRLHSHARSQRSAPAGAISGGQPAPDPGGLSPVARAPRPSSALGLLPADALLVYAGW